MAAYIIFDVEVTDPTAAEEITDDYLKLANESLAPFQSKTIVHGGMVEVLEGDWEPKTLVMVEFERVEIKLQGPPSVKLDASTTNDSVTTQLQILTTSLGDKSHVVGTIGAGDAELFVKTSNGSILIQ